MATLDYPIHGGQLRQIAERFGVPAAELVDFSANINPEGPPPALWSALRASLDDPSSVTDYPDLQQTDLKRSLAVYAGTTPENILVANGFVPLLEATLRALDIRSCLLPVPAFVEYRRTLERMRVEVDPHTLNTGSCFRYDPDALLSGHQQAVLLANPQNPSGVCHDAEAMCEIVGRASEKGMYVLLDEAFIDYVPGQSLTTLVDRFPNLIVFRSVTKFFGIPGLRIAYAATNAALAEAISRDIAPWPVTTLASDAIQAALSDQSYALSSRLGNQARRTELQTAFAFCGIGSYPASANFLLFRLPSIVDADLFWRRMIVEHRLVLRSCANYEALPESHFRVAIRTEGENRMLAAAVAGALREGKLHGAQAAPMEKLP